MMAFELDAFPTKTFNHTNTEVDELTLNDGRSIEPQNKTTFRNENDKKTKKALERELKMAKKLEAATRRKAKATEKKAAKAQKKMDRMESRNANHEQGQYMDALIGVEVLARTGTFLMDAIDFIMQFC